MYGYTEAVTIAPSLFLQKIVGVMSPKLFARCYTEGIADYTYHFADAFVRENVAYVCCFDDGMTFEGLQ